jgi:hypothetical protein
MAANIMGIVITTMANRRHIQNRRIPNQRADPIFERQLGCSQDLKQKPRLIWLSTATLVTWLSCDAPVTQKRKRRMLNPMLDCDVDFDGVGLWTVGQVNSRRLSDYRELEDLKSG